MVPSSLAFSGERCPQLAFFSIAWKMSASVSCCHDGRSGQSATQPGFGSSKCLNIWAVQHVALRGFGLGRHPHPAPGLHCPPCPDPGGPVRPVNDWPAAVQETFAPFATAMAADGLAFLHTQMQAGRCGPVLTAAVENRIVGAIGPMEVRPDAIGCPQLLPQYFALLPEARGQGLGRVLWQAAMHWGQSHGAAYQLLQTEVGGPSDRLCQSEGLASLGFSHTARA